MFLCQPDHAGISGDEAIHAHSGQTLQHSFHGGQLRIIRHGVEAIIYPYPGGMRVGYGKRQLLTRKPIASCPQAQFRPSHIYRISPIEDGGLQLFPASGGN